MKAYKTKFQSKRATIAFYPFLALIVIFIFTTAFITANQKIKELPKIPIGKNQYQYIDKYLRYYDNYYDNNLKLNMLSDNLIFDTAINLNTKCGDYLGIPKINNINKTVDECFNKDIFWQSFIAILKERYLKDYILFYKFHKKYVEIYGYQK